MVNPKPNPKPWNFGGADDPDTSDQFRQLEITSLQSAGDEAYAAVMDWHAQRAIGDAAASRCHLVAIDLWAAAEALERQPGRIPQP